VTFSDTGKKVFVPVREVGKAFDWRVSHDPKTGAVKLNGQHLKASETRPLLDAGKLVSLQELGRTGCLVRWDDKRGLAVVKKAKRPSEVFFVRRGMKRVFINKKAQMLVAYQGRRTVLRTRVSTGRAGKQTPTGIFKAQGYKNKLHRSRLYDNVAMPWSVQIVGNVFVHGFKSVPGRAASSGCIRVPITGENPARWFYYWIDQGTPVTVLGKWPRGATKA